MNKSIELKARLQSGLLVGDGAMATMLYRQGGAAVGTSMEELCLSSPDWIRGVHELYLRAGAEVIETNSYAANREILSRYGLEAKTTRINRAAVQIAKQAVEKSDTSKPAYVLGSIGSILAGRVRSTQLDAYRDVFEEQAVALLHEGVDGLILETFNDLEELLLALEVIKPLVGGSGTPVIAQLALLEIGRTRDGYSLTEAFARLQAAGADMAGLNCRMGPAEIIRSLEKAVVPEGMLLSAFPNAGRPSMVDGEFQYSSSAAYFGESAIRLVEQGVTLLGGCCGTTPEHIRAMAEALADCQPVKRQNPSLPTEGLRVVQTHAKPLNLNYLNEREHANKPTVVDLVKERHTIIVEYDTPRDLEIGKFLQGSRALHEAGADAITMADNALATTRMSNMALGAIMKREIGAEPLVHIACRDRNLVGQQSHLMGLHALGLNQILVITGDPAKVGDLPGASSVFDVTSFELIRMVKQLNEGITFSGRQMKNQARFIVGAAFNPHVRQLDKAVARLERKVEAGADFIMTQPVYDVESMIAIREATRHLTVPIFIGIMPITSYRNAEFLHNEVPGIKIPALAMERIKPFEGPAARAEGVAMAKELLDETVKYFNGIYLITPFHYFDMTVELTKHVHQVTNRIEAAVTGSEYRV